MDDPRRGYRPVIGWLPQRDNDGEEITPERLGPGGARRVNGTLSALVDDIEFLPYGDEPKYIERRRELSPEAQQQIRDFVDVLWDYVLAPIGRAARAEFRDWRHGRRLRRSEERRRRHTEQAGSEGGVSAAPPGMTAAEPSTAPEQGGARLHLVVDAAERAGPGSADVA